MNKLLRSTFLLCLPIGLVADEGIEFFEAKVRPVLVEHCYECHNSSGKAKGKLALDYRDGVLKGGSEGPSVVPGKPDESLLLQSVRHEFDDLEMPKNNPRLADSIAADLAKWITMGAPDPRDEPPTAEELAKTNSWDVISERRMKWWSFQPIRKPQVPQPKDAKWSSHPVDKFVRTRQEEAKLAPNGETNALAILRRLTFAITGLPPTPEQQEAFEKAAQADIQAAMEKLADDLLASPQFGERWARHWMDWVRYADSHGSEGDPAIPNAYQYRNYLIRALNADVPYDQLVREHLAGDLLPQPRINEELGLNESVIGTSHFRFVLHGFAPTDALDEHVRFTDDQIDVVTKAFLGLTVSCSRCHDHKFDAISQKDYYALFGILSNGRPAQRIIESPERLEKNKKDLRALKSRIRGELAKAWKGSVEKLAEFLQTPPSKKWQDAIEDRHPHNPLRTWATLRNANKESFAKAWEGQRKEYQASKDTVDKRHSGAYRQSWKLGEEEDYAGWVRSGVSLGDKPAPAGSFHVLSSGDRILDRILPSGAYTHLLSNKHNGSLSSPRFEFDEGNVWIRATGDKGGTLRYVVWNYPRKGTVYPKGSPDPNQEKWINWNTKYWAGDTGYLEATTSRDHPVEAGGGTRSWLGVTEAVLVSPGQSAPRDEIAEALSPLFPNDDAPADAPALAKRYAKALGDAVGAWEKGKATDAQARMLSFFVKRGLLPVSMKELPEAAKLVGEYRRLEADVVSPRLAPGLLDGKPFDQPLFAQGNHKMPTKRVPRRFLEAIDDKPYPKDTSGRLEYAEDLLRPDNPFTARVIVNRIWHHLFGQGIVATPDNLGRLGKKPSHPEMLDYLAVKFREDGWSIKRMVRFLATSKTFRLNSIPSSEAREKDPNDLLLSHGLMRRLEAEPIRDSILASAKRLGLDRVAEGGSEGANTARRAVYRQSRRNALDPFLSVFDAPVPAITKGRRDTTNVPAQSLTLMNDPFVIGAARDFANKAEGSTEAERISHMFRLAIGRPATNEESARARAYLHGASKVQTKALAKKQALEKEIAENVKKLATLLDPVRQKILDGRKQESTEAPVGPKPSLHWNFTEGWKDKLHGITAHPKNGARIDNGELVVSGGGYAATDKLPFEVREKTLEAWVKLDNLSQRAGGVVTIQSPNGSIFDSIVYAEKEGKHWMAGSNGFRRTKSFGGTEEKESDKKFVHLAITYQSDGTIRGYRNGHPYGKAYKTGKASFPKGKGILSFGMRHLPASPQRALHGRIREVRLYDRALEADAVMASFGGSSDYVSQKELISALADEQRKERLRVEKRIADLEGQLKKYADVNEGNSVRGLHDLAIALFNMKEFIYLR